MKKNLGKFGFLIILIFVLGCKSIHIGGSGEVGGVHGGGGVTVPVPLK